eukprot:TRINITY_DN1312_c0_g1_i6.p1 TRINITY_DN1312_c0_g1~~TRINITY_DN1312_c0_g1_i6.p1  ORF type:complete len:187 (-),score=27.18 TRINITY_DN1312_c0_g1_i6:276-836(-)
MCDGIDINCGCPQPWVVSEGYGCGVLDKPELVTEMVKSVKAMSNLPCSIQVRLSSDLRKTVELVQQAERAGVSWITVHGRTRHQKSSVEVNYEAVKLIKGISTVPIFGNGHCFSLRDALKWKELTGVDGVMSARGILENPALFTENCEKTPREVVNQWVQLAMSYGVPTTTFHQHLMFMLFRTHTH